MAPDCCAAGVGRKCAADGYSAPMATPGRAAAALATALVVALALVPGVAGAATTTTTSPSTTTTVACTATSVDPTLPAAATQALVVTAPDARSTTATLTAYDLVGGCWRRAIGPLFARVGRTGLRRHRHEGDGSTPLGVFTLGATFLGDGPDPHDAFPYRRLACGDWWDEDPASPSYNELVRVPCGVAPPFTGEPLWLEGNAYPIFAVIEFNPHRVPGLGSGIFLHADFGAPTDGCVALERPALYRVLAWLRPADRPVIEIRVAG